MNATPVRPVNTAPKDQERLEREAKQKGGEQTRIGRRGRSEAGHLCLDAARCLCSGVSTQPRACRRHPMQAAAARMHRSVVGQSDAWVGDRHAVLGSLRFEPSGWLPASMLLSTIAPMIDVAAGAICSISALQHRGLFGVVLAGLRVRAIHHHARRERGARDSICSHSRDTGGVVIRLAPPRSTTCVSGFPVVRIIAVIPSCVMPRKECAPSPTRMRVDRDLQLPSVAFVTRPASTNRWPSRDGSAIRWCARRLPPTRPGRRCIAA